MIFRFSFIEKLLLRFNVIPHPLVDSLSSVVAARALQLAVKLGIIDALETGSQPASTIAEKTNLSERGVTAILDCLDALDYVQKRGDDYRLTPRGEKFLSQHSSTGFRNMTLFTDYLYKTFSELEVTVAKGGPDLPNYDTFTTEMWEIFTHAMIELARTNLTEVIGKIPLPADSRKLLDLGGSHGLYSANLCKRVPTLTAEIMDYAAVEPFAEMTIKEFGLEKRTRFRSGDFLRDDLGNGYDVMLAFNIIHGLNNENNKVLTEKVYRALNPGGIYVVLDQIKGMEGRTQLSRLISSSIGLNLFHQTGGCSFSFEEIRQWMQSAGFSQCKLNKIRTPGFALVVGTK